MMRYIITAIIAAMSITAEADKDWGLDWICSPNSNSHAQIQFKKVYNFECKPQSASIRIASNGRYILYVNGYNVTGDVLTPRNSNPSLKVTTYETDRFMRKGNNTIAVWYSPDADYQITSETNYSTEIPDRNKQLSISLYGITSNSLNDSLPFYYHTDDTWTCRTANATTNGEDETYDNTQGCLCWNTDSCIAGWHYAKEYTGTAETNIETQEIVYEAMKISGIYRWRFLETIGDTLIYNFNRGFNGWVRLTLRNMQRGDTINVNGMQYICSGDMDEQACRRFTTSECPAGKVIVTCNRPIPRDNITNVEAISIEPYQRRSYLY